jgi:hypothetical protein
MKRDDFCIFFGYGCSALGITLHFSKIVKYILLFLGAIFTAAGFFIMLKRKKQ